MVLVDGEHYLPVIVSALKDISARGEIVGIVFLGGTEKVVENGDLTQLGYPIFNEADPMSAISKAIDSCRPEVVIDLSDEPIVGYRERFNIAAIVLAAGIVYRGADFEFIPPVFEVLATKPSMAIIGTGKRVGKTAVSAYACRELKAGGFAPAVVAMGRGGPEQPEVIRGDQITIDADFLMAQARQGRHAASDHFEDALMSRIPTVGCRRCGGGMAGRPFISNVPAGALLANELETNFTMFEGSGTAIPPVFTDAVVTIAGVNQPVDYIIGYLGQYRILKSDLVVLTNCEESVDPALLETIAGGIVGIRPGITVVKTVFRPLPLEDISGKKVFFVTTAPESTNTILRDYLESSYAARVIGVSHHLSNRPKLREDLIGSGGKFDVLLTELKAAAVDVATVAGLELKKQVVYCDNVPVTVAGGDLGDQIAELAEEAIVRFKGRDIDKEARAN